VTRRSQRVRRGVVVVSAVLVAPAALSACSVPSADYAQEACGDLTALMEVDSPRHVDLQEHLMRAEARADRAADTDGEFEDLHENLRQVGIELRNGAKVGPAAEERIDEALAVVAERCADLGAPIAPHGASASEVTLQSLRGS
jgi:hypothetical protein